MLSGQLLVEEDFYRLLCPILPLHEILRPSLLLRPRRQVLLPVFVAPHPGLPLLPNLQHLLALTG